MDITPSDMKRKREELGLSMSALARESGLHVSTVSQIESGRLKPYPGQVRKLQEAFERLGATDGRK